MDGPRHHQGDRGARLMPTLTCIVFVAPGHRYARRISLNQDRAAEIADWRYSYASLQIHLHDLAHIPADNHIEDYRIDGVTDWHDPDSAFVVLAVKVGEA